MCPQQSTNSNTTGEKTLVSLNCPPLRLHSLDWTGATLNLMRNIVEIRKGKTVTAFDIYSEHVLPLQSQGRPAHPESSWFKPCMYINFHEYPHSSQDTANWRLFRGHIVLENN